MGIWGLVLIYTPCLTSEVSSPHTLLQPDMAPASTASARDRAPMDPHSLQNFRSKTPDGSGYLCTGMLTKRVTHGSCPCRGHSLVRGDLKSACEDLIALKPTLAPTSHLSPWHARTHATPPRSAALASLEMPVSGWAL